MSAASSSIRKCIRPRNMAKRLLRIVWVLLVCTIFCQTLLTSILALGWVYRWVQHRVIQSLFQRSPLAMKTTWQALTTQDFKVVRTVPNLFRRQPGQPEPIHPLKRWLHHWCHSVWLNFKTGFAGVLTTWSLTLFPCVMWAIAWYTGWHISFTKLYEFSVFFM